MSIHTSPNVWIHGSEGRMGTELRRALEAKPGFTLRGGSDLRFAKGAPRAGAPTTRETLAEALADCNLVLDFSSDSGSMLLADAIRDRTELTRLGVVVGTTGLSEGTRTRWAETTKEKDVSVMIAPNTSLGVLVLSHVAPVVAGVCVRQGFDIEIVETHHRGKKDAPSGTAKHVASRIADALPGSSLVTGRSGPRNKGEIGLHSVRGGGVFGEHEIRFLSDHEEITITHRALSRALFAEGALVLGRWVMDQPRGIYGLTDVDVSGL